MLHCLPLLNSEIRAAEWLELCLFRNGLRSSKDAELSTSLKGGFVTRGSFCSKVEFMNRKLFADELLRDLSIRR